jgi:DNA-binding CsgD family transcriptional regulator
MCTLARALRCSCGVNELFASAVVAAEVLCGLDTLPGSATNGAACSRRVHAMYSCTRIAFSGDLMVVTPPHSDRGSASQLAGSADQLFAVISEAIRAMEDGRVVAEVICVGLARVLPASATAFVRRDRQFGSCAVTCWTQDLGWAALSEATRYGDVGARVRPRLGSDLQWPQIVGLDLLGEVADWGSSIVMRLAGTFDEERFAVFSRRQPFGDDEVRILTQCQGAMTAIDRHAWLLGPNQDSRPVAAHASASRATFTTREVEVLTLLCRGSKARSIARHLGISERTVNKHLANIYRKLGAHDRLVAADRALSLGVVSRASTLAYPRALAP